MKKNYIKHLFTALLLLCATVVSAHDFESNGIYYKITDAASKIVEVTFKGSNYSEVSNEYVGNVVIPENVSNNNTTYVVGGIGEHAFDRCSDLTSIVIPNSVTSIGGSAFFLCNNLTSVTIGNSVTSIGNKAFSYCYGLTFLTIPNSVTSIGDAAFYQCYNLTSVTIGNSVTSIGYQAFYWCSSLTSIEIPNSVTNIKRDAFSCCYGLTSIEIPNSVTSIGHNAFHRCSDLVKVTVASGNTAYDSRENCNAIIETATNTLIVGCKNTVIPNSVTSIGDEAFFVCSSLTSIEIPNSVTSIGHQAFSGCSGLTSITIPNGVTSIGGYLFYDCSGLRSVTIPNSVTSIGEYAFSSCSNLRSVTIPNSVTSIEGNAFISCSSLKEVINLSNLDIVAGAESHGKVALYANKVITVPGGYREGDYIFTEADGVYALAKCLDTDTDCVLPGSYKGNNYVIPANLFKGNSEITSITIPNGVTSIGEMAFYECSGLTYVAIGNGVTSIGTQAFGCCFGLTSVTIPKNVTSIGYNAFYNCSNLKEVINCSKLNIVAGAESHGGVALYAERVLSPCLYDDVEFVYDSFKDFTTLYYTRTFANETDWEPWYMPFDVELSDIENELDVACLNNIHQYDDNEDDEIDRTELEAIKLNYGTLYANYPYIVRAKTAGEKEFVFEDVTVQPFENNSIDCSSVTTKFTFTGSNNKMYNNGCYGLVGNSLVPETGAAAVQAVTSLTQLSNDKVYTLRSARTFLLYSDNISDKLCTGNGAQVGDVSRNVYDTNQYFKIEKINGSYYLYSVAAGKYVSNNGTYVATPTDALTFINVGGEYQWKLRIGGNCLNSQDRGQTANGILVDSWTTTDAGNCYIIEELEASLAPNRWYLNIEARNPMFKAPAQIRLFIRGEQNNNEGDDNTTAIESVEMRDEKGESRNEKGESRNEKGEIYDLAGRKVTCPGKGIYIVNGKRVLIK